MTTETAYSTINRSSLPPHRREELRLRAEECLRRAHQWQDWIEAARHQQTVNRSQLIATEIRETHTE